MRTCLRISLALLMALALSTPVFADSEQNRFSVNASIGPSFANLGTTLSARTALDVDLTDRISVVGEFGMLPEAAFRDATEVAPPVAGVEPRRVNAYHWNGNVMIRPFDIERVTPYVTAGAGSFIADAVSNTRLVDGFAVQDRRRVLDFATNVGAGLLYRFNDYVASRSS